MKKTEDQIESTELELRLDCDCNHPYHFLLFKFEKQTIWKGESQGKNIKDLPELTIWGVFFKGTFWKRVRNAWKYIIKGEYTENVDITLFGDESIKKIFNFTAQCLVMLGIDKEERTIFSHSIANLPLKNHDFEEKTTTKPDIRDPVKKGK